MTTNSAVVSCVGVGFFFLLFCFSFLKKVCHDLIVMLLSWQYLYAAGRTKQMFVSPTDQEGVLRPF